MQCNDSALLTFPATSSIAAGLRVILSSGVLATAGAFDREVGVMRSTNQVSGIGGSAFATVIARNKEGTTPMIASGAISLYAKVYGAASGKVSATANGNFIGYNVGKATTADGDECEVLRIATELGGDAEIVTTTNVIDASENGRTYFLDLAGGFVTTLPAVQVGLRFTFIVKTAPTTSYTIVCPAAATLFKGHVLTNDVNSATDADFGTSGEATITIVQSKAVAGDRVTVVCDGTNWHVEAACSVFDAITIS